ncbi:MAG: metal-dependent transcriptional regulator [Bacteroidota bacterium]|nr:MAG: metal-dependent transcriptional regulator [Bacteroidota bacterium]
MHEMAEELEHATSDELGNRLEQFLGNPKTDPHGDPIPNRKGEIEKQKTIRLSEAEQNHTVEIRSVEDQNTALLKFLSKHKLTPGARLLVKEINQYDSSLEVKVNNKKVLQLSRDVAENLWIIRVK